MQAAITKTQLAELAPHRGSVDEDSGQVYLKFVGALDLSDGLYHGQLWFDDPADGHDYDSFSVSAILGGKPEPPTLFDQEMTDG